MSTPQPVYVVNQRPHRRTRHGLHLVLSILTGGLWIPVWITRILINRHV